MGYQPHKLPAVIHKMVIPPMSNHVIISGYCYSCGANSWSDKSECNYCGSIYFDKDDD